jgi:hypothetical protein
MGWKRPVRTVKRFFEMCKTDAQHEEERGVRAKM